MTRLDEQDGPKVAVSIEQLLELHIADMRMKGQDRSSIATVEQRCKKHLVPYFATVDFAKLLQKSEIKKYIAMRMKEVRSARR